VGGSFATECSMIFLRPLSLLMFLCALLSVSCSATYRAAGKVTKRGSVQVIHDAKDSGDTKVRSAIRREFIKRGFTLTESNQSDFVASFKDVWRYDVLMYLSRLELSLAERRSGTVQAEGSFRNSAMHLDRSVEKVVSQLFEQLDQQGAFGG
jgi:hypothetical protein